MSLAERLNAVLVEMVLRDPEGAVVDPGASANKAGKGRGGHGTHGERGAAPPTVSPLAGEWAAFFGRALDLAEMDLGYLTGRIERPERLIGSAGGGTRLKPGVVRARKARIRRDDLYEGRPSEFVAYVEGCSAEYVRKVRAENGLDSHGLRVRRERPLTAPAREALKTSENPHMEGEG